MSHTLNTKRPRLHRAATSLGEVLPPRAPELRLARRACARRAGHSLLLASVVLIASLPARGQLPVVASTPVPTSRTVLDLQAGAFTSRIAISDGAARVGTATLVDLNPEVRTWLLLTVAWNDSPAERIYHLENAAPDRQRVRLDVDFPTGVVISDRGELAPCPLFSAGALETSAATGGVYAPLCNGRLYLRNPTTGHKTSREWVTDFLRDRVWQGEAITSLVKDQVYRDAYLRTPELIASATHGAGRHEHPGGAPPTPLLAQGLEASLLPPVELGLGLVNDDSAGRLLVGRWYALAAQEGVYLSAIQPQLVSPEIVRSQAIRLGTLDSVEAAALTYLVAFDLSRFELAFALGTEHPRVDWSDRALPQVRLDSLPGPDGVGTVAPLVRTGMLSPRARARVAASFTGGFKRSHSAFRTGALAGRNRGSHYGFIEEGVVLSTLQPDLATVIVYRDGSVDLKTWQKEDEIELEEIRYARQNGVPLVETDAGSGITGPGALVRQWAAGNWSGSQNRELRTLRAGACLVEKDDSRFLLYGYFSSVTPAAMALVFQAYHCRYAMLLDMNALEHTYLAVYRHAPSGVRAEHLIEGMNVLDQAFDGYLLPRFVAYPDNRDFFYLMRREQR